MKGSKSTRQHYGNTERKSSKRSDKPIKLDRKSSRGMIYENEELRLRTININAEVERGQTDIKRLRKENDQLRREIWSLRDEYDRLNKKFKTKFVEHDQSAQNARCSQVGCSCQCPDGNGGGCEEDHSKCNSEESDSCDSCCCHDDEDQSCNEDCCNEQKKSFDSPEDTQSTAENLSPTAYIAAVAAEGSALQSHAPAPSILTHFDHLSVVSEETLSNSEVMAHQTENLLGYTPDISGSQTTLPSLVGPLTPLTPIELVANELHDLQAVVPPLSYFENILQQHMSSNQSSTPGTSSSNSTGKTVIRHTNGWDYNLQSPFTQKRYPANSISPIMNQRSTAQTLTTFVPSTTVTPPSETVTAMANDKLLMENPTITCHDASVIETVPITTMPVNGCVTHSISSSNTNSSSSTSHSAMVSNNDNSNLNSNVRPTHFFGPMKPKLKLNTALANQKRLPPPPPPPTVPVQQCISDANSTNFTNGLIGMQLKCEPPDIYVTNGLATPYKHPATKPGVQPPPIPQRITSTATSAQVSLPRQRRKSKQYQSCQQQQQQQHEHEHEHEHQAHQHQHRHHYQHQSHNSPKHVADANNDACAAAATRTSATITTGTIPLSLLSPTNIKTSLTTALLATNILCMSLNKTLNDPTAAATTSNGNTLVAPATVQLPPVVTCLPAALACFKFINSNINISKPNEPVYAIAQNVCHNLIIAPAVNQPLMTSIVKCCTTTTTPTITKKIMSTTATTAAGTAIEATEIATETAAATALTTNLVVTQTRVLSNIACCTTINSFQKPIITKTPATPTTSTVATSMNCFAVDTMCQTDSANLESILNDIEAISEDILAIQLEKTKSRENLENKTNKANISKSNESLQENGKSNKPYRSEMNLLLTYEGDNPKIQQAKPTQMQKHESMEQDNTNSITRRTKSLEREHTDSPSPNIPDPMQPFPENRRYIGFDRLNKAAEETMTPKVAATGTQTSPVLNNPLGHRPHLPLSPLVTSVNLPNQLASGKGHPPTPPARSFPPALNMKCAGIQRSSSVTYKSNSSATPAGSPVMGGVPPNKSHLFSALANAAAKRAQFRSQPNTMTKSLDTDYMADEVNEHVCQATPEDRGSTDSVRKKTRRVSIVCADSESPATPDKPITAIRTLHTQNSTTASCSDLPAVMPNPALRNLKQTSHSTPNSPHSSRKNENSPLSTTVPPIVSITPATPHHGRNSHGNGSQHHQAHGNSYPSAVSSTIQQQRKNSQDAIKASAAEIACAAANAVRSKCSRRHSDGTVSHANQRSSGASGGTNGGHHHTHHNHHHHQHSSSLVSATNPHHSHHSRQDSNHETVASYSDRNSNSLASSRESSASLSMRSTRRKLSVSSHTGGKIPWCGCWGNGCL